MEDTTTEKSASDELDELDKQTDEYMASIALAAAKSARGGYTLALFEPIVIVRGAESVNVESLTFRPQTIGDIRKAKNDDFTLTAALCDVSPETLDQLSDIDYRATQCVIQGFRMRRAAGGLARKV